jgi:hypothetical protein
MVMSPARLGTENNCAGERQQQLYMTGPSSRQRKRPTSTNLQMCDRNKNVVLGFRWVLDTKLDWPTLVGRNIMLCPRLLKGMIFIVRRGANICNLL